MGTSALRSEHHIQYRRGWDYGPTWNRREYVCNIGGDGAIVHPVIAKSIHIDMDIDISTILYKLGTLAVKRHPSRLQQLGGPGSRETFDLAYSKLNICSLFSTEPAVHQQLLSIPPFLQSEALCLSILTTAVFPASAAHIFTTSQQINSNLRISFCTAYTPQKTAQTCFKHYGFQDLESTESILFTANGKQHCVSARRCSLYFTLRSLSTANSCTTISNTARYLRRLTAPPLVRGPGYHRRTSCTIPGSTVHPPKRTNSTLPYDLRHTRRSQHASKIPKHLFSVLQQHTSLLAQSLPWARSKPSLDCSQH